MTTTEALRLQLDALQTELYQLQAENKKLREAEPQQAQLLDVEGELAQTREENVRLAQQISELSRSTGDEQDERREREQSLRESIATLEDRARASERLVRQAAGGVTRSYERHGGPSIGGTTGCQPC